MAKLHLCLVLLLGVHLGTLLSVLGVVWEQASTDWRMNSRVRLSVQYRDLQNSLANYVFFLKKSLEMHLVQMGVQGAWVGPCHPRDWLQLVCC